MKRLNNRFFSSSLKSQASPPRVATMKRLNSQLFVAHRREVGTGPTVPNCDAPCPCTGASRWSSPGHPHKIPHAGGIWAAIAGDLGIPLCPHGNGAPQTRESSGFMHLNRRQVHKDAKICTNYAPIMH